MLPSALGPEEAPRRVHVKITDPVGLHARPAAVFVQAVARFRSSIRIRNRTTQSDWADARSILGVLALGVESGHDVELEVGGPDQGEAAGFLKALLRGEISAGQEAS